MFNYGPWVGGDFESYCRDRAYRRAEVNAYRELEARIDNLNTSSQRQAQIPWNQHQAFFENLRRDNEDRTRREKAKREAEENRRQAEQAFREKAERRFEDPYEYALRLLKLTPNPTKQETRTAYLRAMKTAHPDVGGTNEAAREVVTAYKTILGTFRSD